MTGDPRQVSRTFRVFVSSTFEDFKEERGRLQAHVFPRLEELCAARGARFQAIDLRWGVSEEAGLDQRAIAICLEEIARCQRVTPRPNFLVLLGDRYGWRPLPARVEADELDEILAVVPEDDRPLLARDERPDGANGWYRRDDNAVPAEYCLRPRELDLSEGASTDERRAAQEAEAAAWHTTELRLRAILLGAIDRLGWQADDPRRAKYVASATEHEIVRGALEVPDAREHIFGFFRSITTAEGRPLAEGLPADGSAGAFVDGQETGSGFVLDVDAHDRLVELKEGRLRPLLGANIADYEATWTGSAITSDHLGELPATLEACLELLEDEDRQHTLCLDAWRSLARVILRQLDQLEALEETTREIAGHEAFGAERSRHFVGRAAPLEAISAYLAGDEAQPLAVLGDPGSGKSALVAKAAERARAAHPGAVTIVRFIGATPASSDGRALLGSVCRQVSRAYGVDESTIPTEYTDLAVELGRRLALATATQPLIVFLDALDQLGPTDPARGLAWLPAVLPHHVRLVVSTLPGDCEAALRGRQPAPRLVTVEPMTREEGAAVLDLWLERTARTLQPAQRDEVLGRFAAHGLPLYLRLAFEEARWWHSYSEPARTVLRDSIADLITDNLFARLALPANHGRLLVSHALGYLAASRHGLSEDELLALLSADDEVRRDFLARSPRSPEVDRLPVIAWSRLYFDLEPYLSEHGADGTTLLAFYHGQLREAAAGEYLAGEEGPRRHAALADYFRLRSDPQQERTWAGGYPRGLGELPYHLAEANRLDELYETLTDFVFLERKAAEVGVSVHPGADGTTTVTYGGVYLLQDDFALALRQFGSGDDAAGGRRPLVVTAVDLGEGLVVRCPWCNGAAPLEQGWRGETIACPACAGPLKVNPFVVGPSAPAQAGPRTV